MAQTIVIGDIHGQFAKLARLLNGSGLAREGHWAGGAANLWFIGDFFDRGAHSLESVALAMRLQSEAAAAGGSVSALLGNHEIMFLAAHHFRKTQYAEIFTPVWLRNGGHERDLREITDEQMAWLRALPALGLADNHLLMHADALFYTTYGASLSAVNTNIRRILNDERDPSVWGELLDSFNERFAFAAIRDDGPERAAQMLSIFGGRRIVHGHTPIVYMMDDAEPQAITEAFPYADGLCINVDGGMYLGGEGFTYTLETPANKG